jgi:hypothetical protein
MNSVSEGEASITGLGRMIVGHSLGYFCVEDFVRESSILVGLYLVQGIVLKGRGWNAPLLVRRGIGLSMKFTRNHQRMAVLPSIVCD